MSCEFIDSITMEVLGQIPAFAQIDRIIMEVLGQFTFGVGSIDVGHQVMEVIGQPDHLANIDHQIVEVLGQWDGCPTCN